MGKKFGIILALFKTRFGIAQFFHLATLTLLCTTRTSEARGQRGRVCPFSRFIFDHVKAKITRILAHNCEISFQMSRKLSTKCHMADFL